MHIALLTEGAKLISLLELLEDPKYKEYFLTVPKLPPVATLPGRTPPWRLWVLMKSDRKWRKKDCQTYGEAFKILKRLIKKQQIYDASISCKRMSYAPPQRLVRIKGQFVVGSDGKKRQAQKFVEWQVKLPADEVDRHIWCPYCRRPTVFKYFTRHHALRGMIDPSVKRCTICGISERMTYYSKG